MDPKPGSYPRLVQQKLEGIDKFICDEEFFKATMLLSDVRGLGASEEQIIEYENKIKVAEAKHKVNFTQLLMLSDKYISENNIDEAKKCVEFCKAMKNVSWTPVFDLEKKIRACEFFLEFDRKVSDVQINLMKGFYPVTKSKLSSLNSNLRMIKRYITEDQFSECERVVTNLDIICEAQYFITLAEKNPAKQYLDEAKKYLDLAVHRQISSKTINELHQRLAALKPNYGKPLEQNSYNSKTYAESKSSVGVQTSKKMTKLFDDFHALKNVVAVDNQHPPKLAEQTKSIPNTEYPNQPHKHRQNKTEANPEVSVDSASISDNHETKSPAAKTKANMHQSDLNDEKFDKIVKKHGNVEILNEVKNLANALNYTNIHNDILNTDNTENIHSVGNATLAHNTNDNSYAQNQNRPANEADDEEPKKLDGPSIALIKRHQEKRKIHQPSKEPILTSPGLVQNVNNSNPNAPYLESQEPPATKLMKVFDNFANKPPIPEKPIHPINVQVKANTNKMSAKIYKKTEAYKPEVTLISLETPASETYTNTDINNQTDIYQSQYENSVYKDFQPSQPTKAYIEINIDGHSKNRAATINNENDKPVVQKQVFLGVPTDATKNNEEAKNCAAKCEALVRMNLDSGNVERAVKVLAIADKLYGSFDYAMTREEVLAYNFEYGSNNKENNNDLPNLATGVQKINLNTNYEVKPSYYNTVNTINQTEKNNQQKVKTVYALKPKEKITLRNEVLNISDDKDEANKEPEGNVNGNKDDAKECLERAKLALEIKDYLKAEKLAKKSDRMNPSEGAKAVLAEVLHAKRAAPYQFKNNNENQELSQENVEEASKCFKIAMEAFEYEKYDKCERFLEKAKRLDKNIQIDCYLSKLQERKEQQRIEKERIEKESVAKQAKNKKSEKNAGILSGWLDLFRHDTKQESSKPKNQSVKYECHDDSDRNTGTGNKPMKADSNSDDEKDNFVLINSEDVGLSELGASGSVAGSNKVKIDDERQAKSEQLVDKAIHCFDEHDFIQAEQLLTAANGLYPLESTQDLLRQVQDQMPPNRDEAGAVTNTNEVAVEKGKEREESKPNAYEENKQYIEEKKYNTTTYYYNNRNYNTRSQSRSKSRDNPGRNFPQKIHGRGRANINPNDTYANRLSRKDQVRNADQQLTSDYNQSHGSGYGNYNQNSQAHKSNGHGQSTHNEYKSDYHGGSSQNGKFESQSRSPQNENFDRSRSPQNEKFYNQGRSSQNEKYDHQGRSSQNESYDSRGRSPLNENFENRGRSPQHDKFDSQSRSSHQEKLDMYTCNPGHSYPKINAEEHLNKGKEAYTVKNIEEAENHFVISEQMHPSKEARHWLCLVRKAKNESSSIALLQDLKDIVDSKPYSL